ncbi:MAG TPA: DUF2207 domain-containing protein [Candidatus Omnitrophota bacterium]|nr:DUF2207 domain-containing protein [Candidatus Omnitrophota bacterium]
MLNKSLVILGIACALCQTAVNARAQGVPAEKILSFQSDILIETDGSMTVTETITVIAANEKIRHGIYRDFPTRYQDRFRHTYNVTFDVLRVMRDNSPEPFHQEALGNGTRVYIGSKESLVAPGVHVYSLTYKTSRQLGFFKDFDELYWNVTGNGWDFVIESAKASVALPESLSGKIRSFEAYTGPSGAQGADYSSGMEDSGKVVFTATRPLQPGEGLTIAVTWPKGYITEPSPQTKARWFIEDNAIVIIGFLGLVLVVLYYAYVWSRFGRDPAKGTIIPLFKPPSDLTPQAVRFIMRMGYDNKVFGCAVINMAVKGFLSIREEDSVYTLYKTGRNRIPLSPDEQELADTLLSSSEIELRNTEHATISAAIRALRFHMQKAYDRVYFLTNAQYFIPGLVGSAVVLVVSAFIQAGPSFPIALFMSFWLTGWSFGTFFLMALVVNSWKLYLRSAPRSPGLLGQALSVSLFCVPFLLGEFFGIGVFIFATSLALVPLLLLLVGVNILFYHLLKAPTLAGRRVMDRIEGFRMYLSVAEKDRMNALYGPKRTPELFEQYLPYALALDVEQEWAQKFASVLQSAGADQTGYRPAWYTGPAWGALGAAGFASHVGGSFSQAISSASAPPGSSSGSGGGGSSGGGGGGGGGGGW